MKFRQLGVIAVLIFVVAGMSFIDVPKRTTSASGSSYHNIIGWAWSDNIGWLSFGCDNEGTCAGVNYGVDMAQDGELSGYAWSDNIGWVVFNRNDLNGCPSSPCKAKVIPGTGEMTGWAKALSADGNGWDGWISLSGSGSYTQNPVWYGAYSYRKKITIDKVKVPSSQTDFPVLVTLTDTDLKNKARSDGADIVFTSNDGTIKLSHEIEKYDSSTGNLTAWVKVPALSSSANTEIYMYYGGSSITEDPTGVWEDYRGVWHMDQNPNLGEQIIDSASGNNGTPTNMAVGAPTFDNVTSGTFSSVASVTLNHTLGSGSNRMLIVSTAHEAYPVVNVTGVSINGGANVGTLVGKINVGTNPDQQVEMWRVMESNLPASGSISVKVDFSGTTNPGVSIMSFKGVAQQAEEAEGSATCTSCASVSRAITTLTNNALIVSAVGNGHTGDYTSHGSGQTEKWDMVPVSAVFAGTIEIKATAGADTQSHNASVTANRQAMYTAAFAPAAVNPQVDGKISKAVSFDGIDDYVNLGTNSSAFNFSGDISGSVWVRTSSDGKILLQYQNSNPLVYMQVGNTTAGGTSNKFVVYLRTNSGSVVAASGATSINDNNWHHLSFVRNISAGKIYLYVDGALDSTTDYSDSGAIDTSGSQHYISTFTSQYAPNAIVDEVRIAAYAKSADLISAEYNNQSSPGTFYSVSSEESNPGSQQISYSYGPLLNALDPAKQFFEGYAWGSDVVGWLRFDARTDYEVRLSGQVCNNNSVCEAGLGENIASCSADCATADFSLQETGNLFIKTVSGNGAFSGKVVISVVPTGGFSEDISLSAYSVSPAIPGAVYKFNTTSCALGEICAILNSSAYASGAEFSISVPVGTGEGVYTITITGVAGGLTRTANISLTVGSIDPGYKEF